MLGPSLFGRVSCIFGEQWVLLSVERRGGGEGETFLALVVGGEAVGVVGLAVG